MIDTIYPLVILHFVTTVVSMAANVAMFLLLVIVGFDKINEVCGPWVFAAWAIINIANLIAAILNHSFEWILPW